MKMTPQSRAIDKIYKRRNRYEIPDWQRGDVWDKKKKQHLIDTVLRGWRLPKFYFRKISEDLFEVVDGQQRLNALFEFFNNELPLSKQAAEQFGGEYYRDLPSASSDAFDDFEIEYDQIEEATEEELKDFFQRLQQGLPLTASERLNAVHSKLRDFCKSIAKHSFFTESVSLVDTRYAYFDIVSKVAAIEIEGIQTGLRYDDLKEVFESNLKFSATSAAAKNLRSTFDFLYEAFDSRSPLLRNRTLIQSFATLAARIVRTGRSEGHSKDFRDFIDAFTKELNRQVELGQRATDKDYIDFQRSVNANLKEGARLRHEILLRKLLTMKPELADLFDPTVIRESGVRQRVGQLGESIVSLIAQVNSLYSSKNGDDLFKATNKTAAAQVALGKPIGDLKSYQDLIDNLYFLFHEGPGSRIEGMRPQSFVDINAMRTELQHDVDHGGGSKVRKKRRDIAAAFKKYSGQTSPYTYSDELFGAVQASLLTAIEADLRNLLAII
jgi:hypothetical protein